MPIWVWLMISGFVVVDVLFVVVIVPMIVRRMLRPIVRDCPPIPPAADAVGRSRQSVRIGSVNLGWAVDLLADERALHIVPNRFGRLIGASPISVPWDRMERPTLGRLASTVRVADTTLTLPRWAVELAIGAGPGDASVS